MPVSPEKEKAIELAVLLHREGLRQGFHHAPRQRGGAGEGRPGRLDGVHLPRHRARRRRPASRPHHRDLRAGVLGQDHAGAPRRREAQKKGGIAAFVDAEHALDVGYAAKLGVRTDDLLISQPDTGEQALEITETLVRSGAVDVLVIDSVADARAARRAGGRDGRRPHGRAGPPHEPGAPQAHRTISKSSTIVIFINQIA